MAYQRPSLLDKSLYALLTGSKLKTPQSELIETVHPVMAWGKSRYDPKRTELHERQIKNRKKYRRSKKER